MSRMKRKNLNHIRAIFREKTGVEQKSSAVIPVSRALVLAAAVVCCLVMVAFTFPAFSSLDGDALSLNGIYGGDGLVYVEVENRSDKVLRFQEQVKLFRWVNSEELPRLDGAPIFENTEFGPHSKGTMTIDLSKAYDMEAIAAEYNPQEWFYLLLTNNGFLFGQDWMCSISLGEQETETPREENLPPVSAEPVIIGEIEEELRFYFEESYSGELMAFNEANFLYQQKVEELLTRFAGTVVPSMSPMIMTGGPSEFLSPEPRLESPPKGTVFDESIPEEKQYLLALSDWTYTDAYGRMVATAREKAWVRTAVLPQRPGETDGGVTLPLVFLLVYDAEQALPENYAFIYGQLHSFEELEKYRVLTDEHYAIYNATDLIYTDLDAYLDYFLTTRSDVYCDAAVRLRVKNIYDFYQEKENIRKLFGYFQFPEP